MPPRVTASFLLGPNSTSRVDMPPAVYLLPSMGIRAALTLGHYELELLAPRRTQVLRGNRSASLSVALPAGELPGGTVTPGLGALLGQNSFQLFQALPLCSHCLLDAPKGHPYREGLGAGLLLCPRMSYHMLRTHWWVTAPATWPSASQPWCPSAQGSASLWCLAPNLAHISNSVGCRHCHSLCFMGPWSA